VSSFVTNEKTEEMENAEDGSMLVRANTISRTSFDSDESGSSFVVAKNRDEDIDDEGKDGGDAIKKGKYFI